ncbi:MAG: hypothetical protein BWX58_01028 [Deltaproteobacteria bacterium ADurb.Bin026]|nr:MAG: hypothetical protein BWX58_01028 [Deltaproteobacteria bacterium ADurb.Bin026]
MNGKSSISSGASNFTKRSNIWSKTHSHLAAGLSILLITTITGIFKASAFFKTKRVCGIGPSAASTRRRTPSAIFSTRSTWPPKSACPGVSMMFIKKSLYMNEPFLDVIVIPRSFSRSMESIRRSSTTSLSRNMPLCLKNWSTSVVFPWSTCAMIAIFLILLCFMLPRIILWYEWFNEACDYL